MRKDFGDLVVDQAIVHGVPQCPNGKDSLPVKLSETPCRLDDGGRTALQKKLRDVLGRLGREVVEDADLNSCLPAAVRSFLGGEQGMVDVSGELAHALRDSQDASSSAGLLLVAAARLNNRRALLMVKLENDTGMQANEIMTEGLRTFDMQYFANLLFTGNSRVYKMALFSQDGVVEQKLQGWAADSQKPGKDVARFFLEKFLGCRYQDDPRELTRRFHDAALDWINSRFKNDSDTRVDYVMAVMVELQNADPKLDPAEFIETHLNESYHDEFAETLQRNGVPVSTFEKNTELIGNRLQRVRIDLAGGAFLVAPLEAVQDGTVALEDLGDGRTMVTVTDALTSTSSGAAVGSRPKPPRKTSQGDMLPGIESILAVPAQTMRPHAGSKLPPTQK